jgi:N-carbamoylputrescine amidase
MHAEPGEIEQNLERIYAFARRASAAGADLVCFPELSVTGYVLDNPRRVYGGRDPQEVLDLLIRIAQEANVLLLAGFIEISPEDRPYISHAAVDHRGLVGIHRKTHLGPPERKAFLPGGEIPVFSHGSTRFGLQLCYEAHFPEISTIMALQGADVLLFPHASPWGKPEGKLEGWLRHLRARAFDNGLFVVACNQVGEVGSGFSFPGVAVFVGPDGCVLDSYQGVEENVLTVNVPAKRLREVRDHRMKYFLPNRRPDLYSKLVQRQILEER